MPDRRLITDRTDPISSVADLTQMTAPLKVGHDGPSPSWTRLFYCYCSSHTDIPVSDRYGRDGRQGPFPYETMEP